MSTFYVAPDTDEKVVVDSLDIETDAVTYFTEDNEEHSMQWSDFIKKYSGLMNPMI